MQAPVAQKRRKRTPSRTESMSGLVERPYFPACEPTGTQQSDSSTDSALQWVKEHGVDPKLSKKLERKYKSTNTLVKREGVPTFLGRDDMRAFSFFDLRSSDNSMEPLVAGQPFAMESVEPRQKRKDNRNSIEKPVKMPNYFELQSQQNISEKSKVTSTNLVHTVDQIHNNHRPAIEHASDENLAYSVRDYQDAGQLEDFDPCGEVQYPEEDHVVPQNEIERMQNFSSVLGETNAVLYPECRYVEVREEPVVIQSYANLDDSIGSLESFHGSEHSSREIVEAENRQQEPAQSSEISKKQRQSSTQTIKKNELGVIQKKRTADTDRQLQPISKTQSTAAPSVQVNDIHGEEEDTLETSTTVQLEVHEGLSKRGKWPVYRLTEPQTADLSDGKSANNCRKCRTYIRDKALKNKEKQTYICAGCKDIYKQRKKDKIDQKTDVARMIVSNDGTHFEIHPDCAKHDAECRAVDLSVDESKRVLYTITRQIRNKEIVKKPKALQIQALKTLNDSTHLTNKECVQAVAQYGVFYHHDSAYRKANHEANANLPNLELILTEKKISHIRNEVDGDNEKEMFVRDISSKQIVCYVDQMFRLAKEQGVDTLISDGAYSLAPQEWGNNTQVYTVHGISPSGICVPLLHCIITSSTAKTYHEVFSLLRDQLVAADFNMDNLTFVTDFERASIIASEKVFPKATHEGCSFHYVRCLLRAKSGHLNDCITADKTVHTWFRRIVALVYFPKQFIELTGLLEPPEGISQEAKEPCKQFIEYFKSNWLENYNRKDMWNKFMVFKNRTTNFAENYHGRVINMVETKNPKLDVLIDAINDDSFESYTRLKDNTRNLRKDDLERQEAVEKSMRDFSNKMQETGIKNMPKEEIYKYLDYMSHYLPTTLK